MNIEQGTSNDEFELARCRQWWLLIQWDDPGAVALRDILESLCPASRSLPQAGLVAKIIGKLATRHNDYFRFKYQ